MKFKTFLAISLIVIYYSLYAKENKSDYNHLKIKISLRVASPDITRKEILKFTENKNGYLMSFQNNVIKVVFPKNITNNEILSFLKGKGTVINQKFSTYDYSEQILNLATKIKVKEDYLQQLYQLTKEANLMQTLDMEKEISKNIEEIETLKGDYNYYSELSSTIEIEINFISLEQRNLPTTMYPGWVSTLGILNFWGNFYEK